MVLKNGVLMALTAQANRARHFELCFVEFAHSNEKLELGKSDSFFLSPYGSFNLRTIAQWDS